LNISPGAKIITTGDPADAPLVARRTARSPVFVHEQPSALKLSAAQASPVHGAAEAPGSQNPARIMIAKADGYRMRKALSP
jgi:hypothetical protein